MQFAVVMVGVQEAGIYNGIFHALKSLKKVTGGPETRSYLRTQLVTHSRSAMASNMLLLIFTG